MRCLLPPLPTLRCTSQEAGLPCSQLHIISVKHTRVTLTVNPYAARQRLQAVEAAHPYCCIQMLLPIFYILVQLSMLVKHEPSPGPAAASPTIATLLFGVLHLSSSRFRCSCRVRFLKRQACPGLQLLQC
jgi:hypothetical protein